MLKSLYLASLVFYLNFGEIGRNVRFEDNSPVQFSEYQLGSQDSAAKNLETITLCSLPLFLRRIRNNKSKH